MNKTILFFLVAALFSPSAWAQCPRIAGIMVNACGTENNNEFVFLLNGNTSLNVNDLVINFPTNGSVTVANTNDFSPPTGVTHTGSCLTLLDDGAVIPANAPVIIFMSNNVQQQYNFSSWCTQYGTVYLLYRNIASPTTPTFANNTTSGGVSRTTTLSINGSPGCTATFTYNLPTTAASADGDFFQFPSPTSGASVSPGAANNGCASPPFELLPVVLKSFTASIISNDVVLNWITSTELNTVRFDVEKSKDGKDFTTIGRIMAAGNSNTEIFYSYTDKQANGNEAFYRLRLIDIDGSWEHSKTARAKSTVSEEALINVFTSQGGNELIAEWNAKQKGKVQITLTDMYGRKVYNKPMGSDAGYNQIRVPVQSQAKGLYIFQLRIGEDLFTRKIIL